MLFENTFFIDNLILLLVSYIIGVIGFWLFFIHLKGKVSHSMHVNKGIIFKASLVGGIGVSFLLTIVIATLTPSVITIDDNFNHTQGYSFYGNDEFLGIGGSYIVNNSNSALQVIGIDEDRDINVVIAPFSIERIRKCPEEYFDRTPTNETHYRTSYRKSAKGRMKPVGSPTVFVFEYGANK